jgi:hypothetical protein
MILLTCYAMAASAANPARAAAPENCFEASVISATDYSWSSTSWFSINNSGDLAGNYCAQDTACMNYDAEIGGAIYDAATGQVETFAAPSGYNIVQMVGMNERGVVVGTALAGNGAGGVADAAGFVYKGGEATLIDDVIGTGFWAATDINASGTIVGYSLYEHPQMTANGRIGWALDKRERSPSSKWKGRCGPIHSESTIEATSSATSSISGVTRAASCCRRAVRWRSSRT